MSKANYGPGGDAKAIARVAKTEFGDFKAMFEHHGWPERGSDMMRKVQTRVVETYGSVHAFEAHFQKEGVAALISLVDGKDVRCDSITEDGFGRTVATCYVDGKDIGAHMVEQGWAWAFVKYSDVYVAEEEVARDAGLGIWQADTMPAWEYRAQRWQVAEQESPAGCPIKGNISSNGKIYHPPWSPWYSRTKISEEQGERWFCSKDEAVAAGWRAPRWN
jgi:hypothetical protein